MKNERIPELRRAHDARAWLESFNFSKRLVRLLQDIEHDQRWKYAQSSPVQLLGKLGLDECRVDRNELTRAEFFWNRRPRLLPVISHIAWLMVAFGLAFWLFIVPAIGYPLLVISVGLFYWDIVQSVRWRRQYELGIDRLIQASFGVEHFNDLIHP